LDGLGELAGLPSGASWQAVSTADLAKFVDRLTVRGLRLEPENHLIGSSAWHETSDGYETSQENAGGTWQWKDVPDGQYRLCLYGWSGEQMAVRWHTAPDQFGDWTPTLAADAQGRIVIGQVTVGMDASAANTLTLQVRCDSPSGVCHALHVLLDPQLSVEGVINVNTAPTDVLLCLPGMTEAVAQRVIDGRPYGDQDQKARGIGDLLMGSVLGEEEEDKLERFRQFAHLLTVRSRVFRVMSHGESLEHNKRVAGQRIHAVVQR
jgi:hypothetical protein